MDKLYERKVVNIIYADGSEKTDEECILKEHTLQIIVNEKPVMRLICTKQHLNELVTGRLYTEGIISSAAEIEKTVFCKYQNEASVFLDHKIVWQESLYENKSCCTGNRTFYRSKKAADEEILQTLPKVEIKNEWIFSLAQAFDKDTELHDKTGATHSCMLAKGSNVLFTCEDIGRHNTIDKAAGYALMNDINLSECMIYTSGRVPEDMVQKVIAAGIPVLVSKSVPTDSSSELAKKYGLTLICRARRDSFTVTV